MSKNNRQLEVRLGQQGLLVGRLFISSGRRSGFAYDERWLASPDFFNLSPELQQVSGVQYPTGLFFLALEDTAPDSWGERVIRRVHAKLRRAGGVQEPLMPVDFILWVDDAVRVGALRLFDPEQQSYLRSGSEHRHVPPLVELAAVLQASRALESGTESEQDLQYLLGRATSLGGARPKSTVIDLDGCLALGKFPSQADQRDVIRGEVLAMHLAARAGIRVADSRVELIGDTAVAVVRRFDRTAGGGRIPYLSAASLLQSSGREREHAYTELVDVLLQAGADPLADIHELWRRLVFNYLICNTDDHLRNTAFLYDARNRGWRLSPAFDLNPMPGDLRESKTWLTEDRGPIDSKAMLLDAAEYFRLGSDEAADTWQEVEQAVAGWRPLARQLGMGAPDLADFEPAFLC
ncbi:type II toxin-antitoxin system HipA family toxin [Thiopseudomonas denitrificans]|uniref:Serine/threonine-protein kinase HipA n=1 Tax=Thiopseudomonas denitrificans TaxID=1501432 RepID=A0A4R6U0T1_9GAMM|nr:HipA domain-containing protein [Thiopseudomonas denitrificans]TDQ39551.1 serine/threonine-protein kinase HipA [Thiopseudomonas denitrificans]